MNPREINFCSQEGRLSFLKFVNAEIRAGRPILKPIAAGDALAFLDYALRSNAGSDAISYLAAKEAALPGISLFQVMARVEKGTATADDVVDACYLTPPEGCRGGPLGEVTTVVTLATMVAPIIKNLLGSKPKGTFFTWSSPEQDQYVANAVREAMLGNYPCNVTPQAVWREIMRPALQGDAKHSDPDYFLQNWWLQNHNKDVARWVAQQEAKYNVKWTNRAMDAAGNKRNCGTSSLLPTQAGMGTFGWVLLIGMAVTAVGYAIKKRFNS